MNKLESQRTEMNESKVKTLKWNLKKKIKKSLEGCFCILEKTKKSQARLEPHFPAYSPKKLFIYLSLKIKLKNF